MDGLPVSLHAYNRPVLTLDDIERPGIFELRVGGITGGLVGGWVGPRIPEGSLVNSFVPDEIGLFWEGMLVGWFMCCPICWVITEIKGNLTCPICFEPMPTDPPPLIGISSPWRS